MDQQKKTRRLARHLTLLAVGMFGFGYALWPLYNVFCNVTGFGGKAIQIAANTHQAVSSQRVVQIRFDASVNSSLPWLFQPEEKTMQIHLGVPTKALYMTMNPDAEALTGQAIYNISPPEASLYFVKTECFCFTQQTLAANESREMPVIFYVKPDLPEHIKDITLSYTFFRQGYNPAVGVADAH